MNAQGDAQTGLVLTRNEIWLLLHALAETTAPTLRWDGNDLEPWEVGELQRKLRSALQAEPVDSIESAVIVPIDSELGAELLGADFGRLALSQAFDLGSLVAACADRGWGIALELPRGANARTPANVTVRVQEGDREFSALERPIVAVARAMLAAAASTSTPDGAIDASRLVGPARSPITTSMRSPPPRSSGARRRRRWRGWRRRGGSWCARKRARTAAATSSAARPDADPTLPLLAGCELRQQDGGCANAGVEVFEQQVFVGEWLASSRFA